MSLEVVSRSRSESDGKSDGEGCSAVKLGVISPDDPCLTAPLSESHLFLFVFVCTGRGVLPPVQGQGSVLYYIQ